MGISKVEYNGETLLDISGDTVTEDTLAEGSTAHNSNGEQITGRAVFGGGGDSTFVINAIGSIGVTGIFDNAGTSKQVIVLTALNNVDRNVADIMAAALSGKQVVLNVDVTEEVKSIYGLPPEYEALCNLYFNLTILTSVSDVTFSAIVDFTGEGTPVITRVSGYLNDTWGVTSVPLWRQS